MLWFITHLSGDKNHCCALTVPRKNNIQHGGRSLMKWKLKCLDRLLIPSLARPQNWGLSPMETDRRIPFSWFQCLSHFRTFALEQRIQHYLGTCPDLLNQKLLSGLHYLCVWRALQVILIHAQIWEPPHGGNPTGLLLLSCLFLVNSRRMGVADQINEFGRRNWAWEVLPAFL